SETVEIGPVTVEIPSGGVTALVGPNGAGKSTLLTMAGRLLGIDEGAIEVSGYDISSTASKDLAKILSVLRQENHFITRLTVRQLVGFGRFPYSKGRLTALDEHKISEAIDFLNLDELEDRYLDQLSGGQRQRAYVAMVLAQDTEYVLLDEPLNNLDMRHSVQMMGRLRDAARELDRTIVVVLHDINFAAHYADHIIAMKDGGVVEAGPVDEIMAGAILTRVFDTAVQVIEGPTGPLAVYYGAGAGASPRPAGPRRCRASGSLGRRVRAAATVGAVQGVDRRDLVGRERHVHGGEVLHDPRGRDRLRDGHDAMGQVPGQHHLGGARAVRLGGGGDRGVLQQVGLALAQRAPGLGEDAVALVDRAQLPLLEVGVQLDLVDRRGRTGGLDDLLELGLGVVRDADG